MKIKICGLTSPAEAEYLNRNHVDYAGMVLFFPKSRRNISLAQAKEIMAELDPSIQKVAVLVSPTAEQVLKVTEAGFDILQAHGEISEDVIRKYGEESKKIIRECGDESKKIIRKCGDESKNITQKYSEMSRDIVRKYGDDSKEILHAQGGEILKSGFSNDPEKRLRISVWKAFNVKDMDRYAEYHADARICGYVFDAAVPGSGKTFDWDLVKSIPRDEKQFLLAGGLNPENVQAAIRALHPDGVDVSSGVEKPGGGKDGRLVDEFVAAVREAEHFPAG